MTEHDLKKGKIILDLIQTTEKALKELKTWRGNPKKRFSGGEEYFTDKDYNLTISEFRDGSGYCLNLNRYIGNTALLGMIETELEHQLAKYRADFDAL